MTGAELRAWRERLGKDEAWARGVLEEVNVPGLGHGRGYGDCRILVERDGLDGYADNQRRLLRAALVAALEAEERAQAKRGPVEPVCPEGVTRGDMLDPDDGSPNVMGDLGLGWQVHVSDSGRIRLVDSGSASPALLEYAAALSRYRAALHAASDVLSAALEAEERAQAAERGPVEPVCPEGVTVSPQDNGCVIRITGRAASSLFVGPVGTVSTLFSGVEAPPALLEYAAALSRYRAAVHAASDRQRKLDAVKAAEEARDAARRARDVAEDALTEAIKAHVAARREAGL